MKKFSSLAFLIVALTAAFLLPTPAAAYNDYGGYSGAFHGTSADAWVLEDGGVLTIKSGGSLIVNSGAIVSISSSVTSNDLALTYGISAATGVFSGALSAATVNTGQGAAEVYLQNQNLRTTDDVTHKNVAATFGITAASGTFTGATIAVSTSATSSQSLCLVGAVAALPATGYSKNCLAVLTSDNALYISTEAVVGTYSWIKVGAQ